MKKDISTFINIIKQINYILSPQQRKWSIGVLICIILGVIWETLGISAVIPFVYTLMEPEILANNQYARQIFIILNVNSEQEIFLTVAIGIIAVYIIKNLFLMVSAYVQAWYKSNIQKSLSTLMLQSYLERPYLEAVNLNCAEVRRWTFVDTDGVYNTVTCLCRICSSILTILALGVFIIYTDPIMAVAMIVVGGFFSIALTMKVKRRMKEAGAQQRLADTYRDKYVNQVVYGIKEVHVMNKQEVFLEKYKEASDKKRKADCQYTFISACPERIIEIFFVTALISIICSRAWAGWDIKEFIPQLAAFAVAAFRILPLLAQISSNISSMVFYRLAVEETYENVRYYRKHHNVIREQDRTIIEEEVSKNRLDKEVRLQNVEWRYSEELPVVISGVSISIRKGEAIGLIGPSGAGKSTLSDIILGLLKPQKGNVLVDDIDIFSIPKQWSNIIGYVPQSIYLIDDTIEANIAFGVDENNIDEQRIWTALEMAKLADYVRGLEKGVKTIVGERGVKLSGGQRQRIAIARTLYFNPDIIVLDEATSALDNETEEAVMESISELQGRKTLIIVAHRLSTIRKCDKIYEVSDGKICLKKYDEVFG